MRRATALSAVLAALLPAAATAQDLVTAADPAAILNAARGWGSAVLEKDSGGDPLIRGRINGTPYLVYFYGCTDNVDCQTLQFSAAWDLDGTQADVINAWNRDRRFGKAYLDDENDPALEMNLTLKDGVSQANLEANFEWWQITMGEYETYIYEAARTPIQPERSPAGTGPAEPRLPELTLPSLPALPVPAPAVGAGPPPPPKATSAIPPPPPSVSRSD